MDISNNPEKQEVLIRPDIHIQKHPKSTKYKKIYYIVFIVVFILGFIVGTGTNYNDGGQVMNRYAENNGEYFPAHEDKYTGWYFLRFTFEGEGWQHNYLYDMGYSDDKTYWGEIEETYSENFVLCIVLNTLLATAPFIFEFVRKKECENTELNIKEDRLYGSSGLAIIKKKVDIPFKSINNIAILETKADKLKSGKTIEVLYGDKKAKFSYIHNADDVKKYINECVSEFKNKKEEIVQTTVIQNDSTADELKKFKDLLDSGAITQEEFETKKKQLLGL